MNHQSDERQTIPWQHEAPLAEETPVIDLNGVMSRIESDMELFQDFVRFYDEDKPALVKRIEQAVANRDGKRLHDATHSYRGLVSNIGGQRAYEAAKRLQVSGDEDDWDAAERTHQWFRAEIEQLDQALRPYRR